jgi:hypothetical protein
MDEMLTFVAEAADDSNPPRSAVNDASSRSSFQAIDGAGTAGNILVDGGEADGPDEPVRRWDV